MSSWSSSSTSERHSDCWPCHSSACKELLSGPSRSHAVLSCELTANCLAQAGDAVWEAEGVVPLAAMLDSRDPEQFNAAASAIAELANPKNTAFQARALLMPVPSDSHVQ